VGGVIVPKKPRIEIAFGWLCQVERANRLINSFRHGSDSVRPICSIRLDKRNLPS
jgi:hypothetical protein